MAGLVNRFRKWVTGRRSRPGEPSSPGGSCELCSHGLHRKPSSPGGPGETSSPGGPGETSWNSESVVLSWPEIMPGTDKQTPSAGQELSNVQLLRVAETLGHEWERVAFHLELETKDLDRIKAEHKSVTMQKYEMLQLWRHRRQGKATAQDLLRDLKNLGELRFRTRRLLIGYQLDEVYMLSSRDSGSESMNDSDLEFHFRDSGSEKMPEPESELSVDGRMFARDNETRSAGQDLTDMELLKVVKTLGKEWEQVAIHLDLKTKDLDDIKAEERNVAMQKFKMLQLWQHRSPGKATVEDLLRGLEDMEELPVETHQLLKGLKKNRSEVGKKKSSCSSREESCLGEMSSALPLKMPNTDTSGATGELQRIHSEFVQRVSTPVIEDLLDDLWTYGVLSTVEKEVMEEKRNKKEMAHCLIHVVISKRERASRIMIYCIKERDPDLYSTLGLISSIAGVEHVTNEIDGPSSSGSSGQGSLSDFDGTAGSPLVGPVQEKTPDPERTEVNVNTTGSGSDVDINNVNPPVHQTGLGWNRIQSFFLKKQSFSTRQGRLSGAAYVGPHRRTPESDCKLDNEDDEEDEEEMHFKVQCEKCKAAQQSPEYEKVTPRKISKWSFRWKARGPMSVRLQVWCLKCRSRLWSATRSCAGPNSLSSSRTPGDLLDRFMVWMWSTRIHLCSSLSNSHTLCALLSLSMI